MPRLSVFYGIAIYMYRPDHPPPHFHAEYGEHVAQIELGSLEILNGIATAPRAAARSRMGSPASRRARGELGSRAGARAAGPDRPARVASDPMLRVIAVTPLDGYRLRVEFNDGVVRDVDCSFLLHGTLGEPLIDPDYFRQVRVDEESRTIVWPNGLDPAPELLHGDYEPASTSAGDSQPAAA